MAGHDLFSPPRDAFGSATPPTLRVQFVHSAHRRPKVRDHTDMSDPAAAPDDRCGDAPEPPRTRGHAVKLAAVMTCDLGVLIGHNIAANETWQFPTIDGVPAMDNPGVHDLAAAALARGVHEQTGLSAVIHGTICRHDNQHTHMSTVYLACTPTLGFGRATAGAELHEVQWAPWPEAEQLIPGMPRLVHDFLVSRIGWQTAVARRFSRSSAGQG